MKRARDCFTGIWPVVLLGGVLAMNLVVFASGPPTYVPESPPQVGDGWGPAEMEDGEPAEDAADIFSADNQGDLTAPPVVDNQTDGNSAGDVPAQPATETDAPADFQTSEQTGTRAEALPDNSSENVPDVENVEESVPETMIIPPRITLQIAQVELDNEGVQASVSITDEAARHWRVMLSSAGSGGAVTVTSFHDGQQPAKSGALNSRGIRVYETEPGKQETMVLVQVIPDGPGAPETPETIRWTMVLPVE